MDDCVGILIEGNETDLDMVLATQARCHAIINEMTHSVAEWANEGRESTVPPPPPYFVKAMEAQLQVIWRSLTSEMQSNSQLFTLFYRLRNVS
jgi:hypothetical protein